MTMKNNKGQCWSELVVYITGGAGHRAGVKPWHRAGVKP